MCAVVQQEKKPYTPFPPAQLPRKIDQEIESGAYFTSTQEKHERANVLKEMQKAGKAAEREQRRSSVYIEPKVRCDS
jgi:ribosomal RNA assembly protein